VGWAGLPEANRRVALRWLVMLAQRALTARGAQAGLASTRTAAAGCGEGVRP
jgi:hypothetical protein